jgi:hypothetical protein
VAPAPVPESPGLNYFDYLQGLLGFAIRHDNQPVIERLPLSQLNAFRERYHEDWQAFHSFTTRETSLSRLLLAPAPYRLKRPVAGEFRPLLHGQLHRSAYAFGGDESHPWEHGDSSERVIGLKRFLLYSHRLVLADPLWYINQYFGGETDTQYTAKSRLALARFLDFVYTTRELIQADIVLFYPQYEHTGLGFEKNAFQDDGFMDWYKRLPPEKRHADPFAASAHHHVVELLFYFVRNGASAFIDNPKLLPAFESVLAFGRALGGTHRVVMADSIESEHRAAMQTLSSISLPTLDALSLRDIVAVRTQADGFEQFRSALREGLLRIDSAASADHGVIREAVNDSLATGRAACEREMEGSSFLSHVHENMASFGIGALAGLMAGDPTLGLATGGATAGLTVLYKYVSGLDDQTARQAVLRHYAVWDSGE